MNPAQAIQAALAAQGFPSGTIDSAGNLDFARLLSGVYSTVTFRSRLTPTITIRTSDLFASGPPPLFAKLVQPAVVFSGRAGTAAIAPFGIPVEGVGWVVTGALVLGLVAFGYALGRR